MHALSCFRLKRILARVAKLVDAYVSGAYGACRVGSSPISGTFFKSQVVDNRQFAIFYYNLWNKNTVLFMNKWLRLAVLSLFAILFATPVSAQVLA